MEGEGRVNGESGLDALGYGKNVMVDGMENLFILRGEVMVWVCGYRLVGN